jgi:hypothetical protein
VLANEVDLLGVAGVVGDDCLRKTSGPEQLVSFSRP